MAKRTSKGKGSQAASLDKTTATHAPSVFPAAVFSFLKDSRGVLTWIRRDLEDCLKVGASEADQVLMILRMQGYVQEKADSDQWMTTTAGETVSGSKAPHFKRETVEEALSTLRDRLSSINRDKRSEFQIRRSVAFGDFLSGRPLVQAADVGVMLGWRPASASDNNAGRKDRTAFKQIQGKSHLVKVQRYEKWMSERTHRDLL
jgi:hypothetical protein